MPSSAIAPERPETAPRGVGLRARRAARRRVPARALGLAGCVLLLVVVFLVSLAAGSRPTPVPEVVAALQGQGDAHVKAVVESRIPRTVLGLVVGGALAVSGVIIQGITRNPLGEPGLLGVNVGAAASIVTATGFLGLAAGSATVWAALPGGLLAVLVVYLVGGHRSGGSVVPLVLAGAVVTALLGAYIQAVTLTMPQVFDGYRYWVVGSLAGRDLSAVTEILPFVVVGLVVAAMLASGLNALALGESTAVALGTRTGWVRAGGIGAATLLASAATAAVGPVAFVGLAVPHVVRSLVGSDHRWTLPYSLVLGGVLLVAADVVGRVVARPQEIAVGVVTAFVGAPFLLLAVRRMRAEQ